jgi:anti-sigma B factor antagonist
MQCTRPPRCPRSKIVRVQVRHQLVKIHVLFMIPNPLCLRLSTRMKFSDSTWQTWPPQQHLAGLGIQFKESKLKLSLETRHRGDVVIVYCQGRIVYRDEATSLSSLVGEVLKNSGKVVLDLSGVSSIDSAGIGELVLLHTWAQAKNADLRCASPSPFVRDLLGLTRLDSFFEIHPSLHEALAAFQSKEVCADC